MPILADYHMHTPRCKHAAGPIEAYVERGIELGLTEIGFSDHNPLPHGLGANVRMDESELDDYVADVLRLRDQYRGRLLVRLGLEMDYVEGLEPYLEQQRRGYPWDYVAHFDLPKRSGHPATVREAAAVTQTLGAIACADLCMEINTSGLRHLELAQHPEEYPAWDIVTEALALGIPLTVNSDSHAPDQVGTGFGDVAARLRAAGCRTLARFAGGKRETYAI